MAFYDNRRVSNSGPGSFRSDRSRSHHPGENTGAEAAFLRAAVDSGAFVTVVLSDGEQLHGIVRYYDRELISLHLADRGLNILIRKDVVSSILEG